MDVIEWDVDNPQVKKLIEAAQVLHWGTMSIGLALGLGRGSRLWAPWGFKENRRTGLKCEAATVSPREWK